jgi:hypothetical protein
MGTYAHRIYVQWGTDSAPASVFVLDAAGVKRTPTLTTAIAEVTAGTGNYFAVATYDHAWGEASDFWRDAGGAEYPGDGPAPTDVVMVNGGPATLDTGGGTGGTGDGDFAINHDGGEGVLVDDVPATPGCMSMEYNGQGIDNGRIIAFLKSDYDAGRRGQNQRQGVTWTNADGDWVSDLMLDAGQTYTIQASAGRFFTRTFKVEIP